MFLFSQVVRFSLVLVTKDFNPEKYETLSGILCQIYQATGNPAKLLEQYLSVLTKGSCQSEDNGTFLVQEFDEKRAYAGGSIKGNSILIVSRIHGEMPVASNLPPELLTLESSLVVHGIVDSTM